jgi:hypothetical protein
MKAIENAHAAVNFNLFASLFASLFAMSLLPQPTLIPPS